MGSNQDMCLFNLWASERGLNVDCGQEYTVLLPGISYTLYCICTQAGFTIFFDLEVIFKMWCLGVRGYWRLSIHKFEFILAVGTTLRMIPYLFMTSFTFFQVSVALLKF